MYYLPRWMMVACGLTSSCRYFIAETSWRAILITSLRGRPIAGDLELLEGDELEEGVLPQPAREAKFPPRLLVFSKRLANVPPSRYSTTMKGRGFLPAALISMIFGWLNFVRILDSRSISCSAICGLASLFLSIFTMTSSLFLQALYTKELLPAHTYLTSLNSLS